MTFLKKLSMKLFTLVLLVLSIAALHAQTVAYVANNASNVVSVIDTASNHVTANVLDSIPFGVVFSPDGTRAYVTSNDTIVSHSSVSVFDTASNTVIFTIPIAGLPGFPGITPDGKTLYVPTGSTVAVVSTATNSVVTTIPVPAVAVAVTPDGAHAYALGNGAVSVIDTATNTVAGSPIAVASIPTNVAGFDLRTIAVTPGGGAVYMAGGADPDVPVIVTASNTVVATIPLSGTALPTGLAITPDGGRVYVSDPNNNVVDVVDTATNTVEPSPISVGAAPARLAITPDGASVYVTNLGDSTVAVISTATNTVVGSPIVVGNTPIGIAIANISAPFAAFTIDNLVINNNLHEQGDFTLGANTGGIDLAHQPLTLTVNSFSLTIPAGSFRQVGGNMHFVFNGAVNGLGVNFNINAVNGSSTQFTYVVDVHGANVTGPNPATVGLKIGHNLGTTTAEF